MKNGAVSNFRGGNCSLPRFRFFCNPVYLLKEASALEAGKLIAAGLILGVAGLQRPDTSLSSLLLGVQQTDFATFVGVSMVLAAIACRQLVLPLVAPLQSSQRSP